jgi:hypothetical protein
VDSVRGRAPAPAGVEVVLLAVVEADTPPVAPAVPRRPGHLEHGAVVQQCIITVRAPPRAYFSNPKGGAVV